MQEPEPGVVKAARSGDLGAFAELVRHYQGHMWRLCYSLLRDEGLAEDAVQEAFTNAYSRLDRFRGESKFSTWLFAIARNCALDELRRSSRRLRIERRLEAEIVEKEPDSSVGYEVRQALGHLPLDLREPIVLIDLFGMSYREAADVLEVREGTVKSRVHRGRLTLARSLGPRQDKDAQNED